MLSSDDSDEDSADDIKCNRCSCTMDPSRMLLCDGEGCTVACHIYCLQPPLEAVPDDPWYCPTHARQPVAERLALEQSLGYVMCGVNGCILRNNHKGICAFEAPTARRRAAAAPRSAATASPRAAPPRAAPPRAPATSSSITAALPAVVGVAPHAAAKPAAAPAQAGTTAPHTDNGTACLPVHSPVQGSPPRVSFATAVNECSMEVPGQSSLQGDSCLPLKAAEKMEPASQPGSEPASQPAVRPAAEERLALEQSLGYVMCGVNGCILRNNHKGICAFEAPTARRRAAAPTRECRRSLLSRRASSRPCDFLSRRLRFRRRKRSHCNHRRPSGRGDSRDAGGAGR